MGYMGFGMQSWIFRQRPRKPFSKERKPSGDTIKNEEWYDFNIVGRTTKNIELIDGELVKYKQKISNRRSKERIFAGIILLSILSLFILLIIIKPWDKNNFSGQSILDEQKRIENEIQEQFEVSLRYGDYYYKNNEFESAISEFSIALKLFPDNLEATVGLAKSYLNDCLVNHENCDMAKRTINKLLEQYPENPEYLSYSISLEDVYDGK